MSTFVIGDIQGCYQELKKLLEKVDFRSDKDDLIIAGDLINRGPENLQTLELLQDLNARCVLGNHDLHFLAVATGTRMPSRSDTFQDLLESPSLDRFVSWMLKQPLLIYLEPFDTTIVHAGIPHTWSLDQAQRNADDIEVILDSETRREFFEHMYGNSPTRLDSETTGLDRARVITNYLTRMRFCDEEGHLELETKSDSAPEGYAPWFSFDRTDSTRIIFGHWAALEGRTSSEQFVALDTGCVWGQRLTAICLDDNSTYSVAAIDR